MSLSSLNRFSMDFFSLKGKTAVITGSNRGLGQIFAVALAKAGANLFAVDITEEDCNTRELVESEGIEIAFMQADIATDGVPENIIAACCDRFGTVDILINNAGICHVNDVFRFDRTHWDPMININLTAAFELSHHAAKIMIAQKSGKIINVCSIYSWLGGRWTPAYAATKHALAGLTKAYCDELAEYNIQVNGIAPGYYETEMTSLTRRTPKENKRVLDHIPAKRWGEPQDLMGAIIFLSSPASDYVNGHLLAVDGGYLVR